MILLSFLVFRFKFMKKLSSLLFINVIISVCDEKDKPIHTVEGGGS